MYSSKFILPKKISSAREIERVSSVEDMSIALLSCLLPEDDSATLSPVKETIKRNRDDFIRPQLQVNTNTNTNTNTNFNTIVQLNIDRNG